MIEHITNNASVYAVVAIVIAVLLAILGVVRRYRIPQPNEAIIVAGRRDAGDGLKVVLTSGVFVIPFIQRAYSLSLASQPLSIAIDNAISKNNIQLSVEAVAVIKVNGTPSGVRAAAQRFLSAEGGISGIAREVLGGALRAVIGEMEVEAIIRDRKSLEEQISDAAATSLTNQGLQLDTLQIKDISDQHGYIANLGRPEAAAVFSKAQIAEAQRDREAKEAQFARDVAVAEAAKNAAVQQAAYKQETDRAQAIAAAVGPLEAAAQNTRIVEAEQAVATQRAALTERELDTTVRKPADASLYQAEQEAAAAKARTVAAAQAEAERIRVTAEAVLDQQRNQAEGIEAIGKAEAVAIEAKGEAEAKVKDLIADAFAKYGTAAILDGLVKVLPELAQHVAAPLGEIGQMTVISTDGASAITRQTANILTQIPGIVQATTGIDLPDLIGRIVGASQISGLAAQTATSAADAVAGLGAAAADAVDKTGSAAADAVAKAGSAAPEAGRATPGDRPDKPAKG